MHTRRLLSALSVLAVFVAAAALAFTPSVSAAAKEKTATVPGQANIFGAGGTLPPASAGAGTLPTRIELGDDSAPRTVTITSVTGEVGCCGSGGTPNGPAGGSGSTNVSGFGGVSGVAGQGVMFMLGVFTNGRKVLTRPTRIGGPMTLNVPAKATHLHLGFADAYAFSGSPDYYGDNVGAFTAKYTIARKPTKIVATVVDAEGKALPGATVSVSGPQSKSATTDARGVATITVSKAGRYTATPKSLGRRFDPSKKSLSVAQGRTASVRFKQSSSCTTTKKNRAGVKETSVFGAQDGQGNTLFVAVAPCRKDAAAEWEGTLRCDGGVPGFKRTLRTSSVSGFTFTGQENKFPVKVGETAARSVMGTGPSGALKSYIIASNIASDGKTLTIGRFSAGVVYDITQNPEDLNGGKLACSAPTTTWTLNFVRKI